MGYLYISMALLIIGLVIGIFLIVAIFSIERNVYKIFKLLQDEKQENGQSEQKVENLG